MGADLEPHFGRISAHQPVGHIRRQGLGEPAGAVVLAIGDEPAPARVCADAMPLARRESLFAEDLDRDDPWQFKNIRVV